MGKNGLLLMRAACMAQKPDALIGLRTSERPQAQGNSAKVSAKTWERKHPSVKNTDNVSQSLADAEHIPSSRPPGLENTERDGAVDGSCAVGTQSDVCDVPIADSDAVSM